MPKLLGRALIFWREDTSSFGHYDDFNSTKKDKTKSPHSSGAAMYNNHFQNSNDGLFNGIITSIKEVTSKSYK